MSGPNLAKAEFRTSYGLKSQLPRSERPEIVFSGRSNVGKSSLINKLCNRRALARVSSTPGKTATINFYSVGDVDFVDLPGYGYAKTSRDDRRRWDELVNGYFTGKRDIRLLLQLLDCRHAPSQDDLHMLEYLAHYDVPFAAVLTKADKCKPSQYERINAEFEEMLRPYNCKGIYLVSTLKGIGIAELTSGINAVFTGEE